MPRTSYPLRTQVHGESTGFTRDITISIETRVRDGTPPENRGFLLGVLHATYLKFCQIRYLSAFTIYVFGLKPQ